MTDAARRHRRGSRSSARGWTAVLAALASANLTFGVWMFFADPARSADLREIARWAGIWRDGLNPYLDLLAGVDYPPWALVMMAPLSFGGTVLWRGLWTAIDLGALVWLLSSITQMTREPVAAERRLVLLCAAAAASHTIGQFSVLAFALALAGSALGGAPGAVLLGLALFKPQIGGLVWLWMVFERRWRPAAAALVVPAVLLLVFCARAGVAPVTALSDYARSLRLLHGDSVPFTGHTDLMAWLLRFGPAASSVDARVVVAIAVFVPVFIAAILAKAMTERERLERLGWCGAASLLAVRHLSYDLIVLFPLLAAWRTWPFSSTRADGETRILFIALAAFTLVPLASLVRLSPAVATVAPWLLEADRAGVTALWVWLGWRSIRPSRVIPARQTGIGQQV